MGIKKIKFNQKSKLLVRRIVGTKTDEFGTNHNLIQWFEVKDEVDLGSFAKPLNTDIIQIKYQMPQSKPKSDFSSLFGG